MNIDLLQRDADILLQMDKHRASEERYRYPGPGSEIRIPLLSSDKREAFSLDICRSQVNLLKGRYQNRGKTAIILARLDFGGPGHRNPDGNEIAVPHLHIYKEGFGDKWAYELPKEHFSQVHEPWVLLQEFMKYINVVTVPNIEESLFQ